MSVRTKKPPIEVQITMGGRVLYFSGIPSSKLKHVVENLKDYQYEIPSWRDVAKGKISESGGESAYMVRAARESAGMTQVELANRLEIPQPNLSAIESGRRSIGKALAKKLGKVFGLDYRVFL